MTFYQRLLFPIACRFDAETTHDFTLRALAAAQRHGAGRALLLRVAGRIPDRPVEVFGLRFAAEGLLRSDDVTIMYVRPQSPATGAKLATGPRAEQSDEEIYRSLLWPPDTPVTGVRPGLLMGDVLVAVNGEPVAGRWSAMTRLLRAAPAAGCSR